MSASEIGTRGESFNAAFYKGEAREIEAALKEAAAADMEVLREASGIDDTQLLQRVMGLGIRAETLAALTLAPLVEVAWADGVMDTKERDAILQGAASTGIEPTSWSYRLLEIWTAQTPPPALFHVWSQFAEALTTQLSEDERGVFQNKITGRARSVAEAAGDILGQGSNVSDSEEAVLTRVEGALGGS